MFVMNYRIYAQDRCLQVRVFFGVFEKHVFFRPISEYSRDTPEGGLECSGGAPEEFCHALGRLLWGGSGKLPLGSTGKIISCESLEFVNSFTVVGVNLAPGLSLAFKGYVFE